jgi:cytidylate kinase
MRIPQIDRTIAIYGGSCTGKTSIAVKLAELTGMTVRHCGQLARERAEILGLSSIGALPREEHEAIDAETRKVASAEASVIIEGRFLDQVLGESKRVVFVRLTCDSAMRECRLQALIARHSGIDSIQHRDKTDTSFRAEYYCSGLDTSHLKMLTIDTTSQSVDECAGAILKFLISCDNDAI